MNAPNVIPNAELVVARGLAAWREEKHAAPASRERWRLIGEALLIGRRLHAQNKAFGEWCQAEGFGDMHRNDRSDAMWLAEHWGGVAESSATHRHPHAMRRAHREATRAQASPPVREQSPPPQAKTIEVPTREETIKVQAVYTTATPPATKATPATVAPPVDASEAAIQKRIDDAVEAAAVRWITTGKHLSGAMGAPDGAQKFGLTRPEWDRLVASFVKLPQRLHSMMAVYIGREVWEGVAARNRELDEAQAEVFYTELEKRLVAEVNKWHRPGGQLGVAKWMTRDEFRRVRSCLASDRIIDDGRKLDEAAAIFNRLEATVDPRTAIAYLRQQGWENFSSRYKPAKKK